MSNNTEQRDKRRHPRVVTDAVVSYKVIGKDIVKWSRSADISEGGMKVYSDQPAAPGDKLKLTIEVAGSKLDAKAIVKWACPAVQLGVKAEHPYALGLEFIETNKFFATIVRKYVNDSLLHPEDETASERDEA